MAAKKVAKACTKVCRKDIKTVAGFFVKLFRSGITPGLVPYFFWSSMLYIATGLFTMHAYYEIKEFLCKIPAEANLAAGREKGCKDCEDEILMCGKGQTSDGLPLPEGVCWKYAVNLTIQEYGSSHASEVAEYEGAALDSTCNDLVRASSDPVSMLEAILSKREVSGENSVSSGCVAFHCRVLQNALSSRELTSVNNCSNNLGMKPAWEAESCPCNAIDVSSEQELLFPQFDQMCLTVGGLKTNLVDTEFYRLLLPKPTCYVRSVWAQSTGQNALAFRDFRTNPECTQFMHDGNTVFSWFVAAEDYKVKQQISGQSFTMPSTCTTVMCSAFDESLQNSQCDWHSDVDLRSMTRSDLEIVSKYCDLNVDSVIHRICDQIDNSTKICQEVTTSRRLQLHPAVAPPAGLAPAIDIAEDVVAPHSTGATLSDYVEERKLQTVQDFEVGDWGKCTCMQTCGAGIQTRSVVCPGDPTEQSCHQPKPSDVRPCECTHCASCNMKYTTVLFAGLYVMQGSAAFFLWLAFWMISSRFEEDDFADVRFFSKLLGCFCKFLPGIVRFFTFSTFVFLGVILAQAFLPVIGQSDCKESKRFQFMAVLVTVTWFLQMILGVYMRKHNPMPPWLHQRSSNSTVRFLCRPCRALGP